MLLQYWKKKPPLSPISQQFASALNILSQTFCSPRHTHRALPIFQSTPAKVNHYFEYSDKRNSLISGVSLSSLSPSSAHSGDVSRMPRFENRHTYRSARTMGRIRVASLGCFWESNLDDARFARRKRVFREVPIWFLNFAWNKYVVML